MMRKKVIFLATLGLAASLMTAAQAAPIAPVPLGADTGLITKVHGCHRICELGPAGWHYHAGPACRRVPCGASPGGGHIWFCEGGRCGWWHPHHRRWHG
jgi:hypothetical protein